MNERETRMYRVMPKAGACSGDGHCFLPILSAHYTSTTSVSLIKSFIHSKRTVKGKLNSAPPPN